MSNAAVKRTSRKGYRDVFVLARRDGHGLGLEYLDPDGDWPAAELRLPREQVLRGRLIDLQIHPPLRPISIRSPDYMGQSGNASKRALVHPQFLVLLELIFTIKSD